MLAKTEHDIVKVVEETSEWHGNPQICCQQLLQGNNAMCCKEKEAARKEHKKLRAQFSSQLWMLSWQSGSSSGSPCHDALEVEAIPGDASSGAELSNVPSSGTEDLALAGACFRTQVDYVSQKAEAYELEAGHFH